MADIYHTFIVQADLHKVFLNITTQEGLDNWWTKSATGTGKNGEVYNLFFGEEYNWKAIVTRYETDKTFELQLTVADADWLNTKVGFILSYKNKITEVQFYHTGWPEINEHYKISSYCWAMYLRILKRYTETGEQIIYEDRLTV